MQIVAQLLHRYETRDGEFLCSIVTGDEVWLHHFDPETKQQSIEWHHVSSPKTKKALTSTGKVMGTVSWDIEGFSGTW